MSQDAAFPVDVSRLFRDPDMFDDADEFRDAGFDVVERSRDTLIMVGRHRHAKDYVFKKYNNDTSLRDQLENYERRVAGAQALRAFITEHHLEHITVPQKWLYELPRSFGREKKGRYQPSYIVIAEYLKLCDPDDSKDQYSDIDKRTLKELCLVVANFRGLDSSAKNMPFTKDGQIAFIDTEGYGKGRDEYLRYVGKLMPRDRWDAAMEWISDYERDAKRRRKDDKRARR